MRILCLCTCLVLASSVGCVFDGGPSLPEPGQVENNANNQNNDNNINNIDDLTDDLAVEPVTCDDDQFPLFLPIPADAPLEEDAALNPASKYGLSEVSRAAMVRDVPATGFGWAHVVNNTIWVAGGTVAATTPAANDTELLALSHAQLEAFPGEEVTAFELNSARRDGDFYEASVFTNERVLECVLRSLPTESTCETSDGLQQILVQNDVYPLARTEFMPFLERPEPTVTRATIENFGGNYVILGVGGPPAIRSLAAVRVGFLGSGIAPLSIPTLTQGRSFYGGRLSIGVTEESNGFPYLLMLAQDGIDAEPEPVVFVSDGEKFDVREIEDVDWILHPDIAADSSTFSFVAKNSVRTTGQSLLAVDFDAVRSVSEFGYVGVGLDPETLLLSAEQPAAGGAPFFRHSHDAPIVELGAGIGIRFYDDLVEHEPLVVFVDEGRDSLTFFRWDLSIETEWVQGVGSKLGLSDIQDLQVPPVHFDDVSKVGFRARVEGSPVVGALLVPEVSALERSLCVR